MIRYLLDTNVISELRRNKPHGGVVAWVTKLREEQMLISAVTLGELQAGVERLRPNDAAKAIEIECWIDRLEEIFEVLPLDAKCLREWGRLMHRKPAHLIEDGMIAASAKVHQLIIATRNKRDFDQFEVETINPFDTK